MGGMKRGVLFTVSLMLIASSFLYLIAAASLYSTSARTTATELAAIERLNAHSDGISHNLESILFSEAVNATITSGPGNAGTLTFTENLPFGTTYYLDLQRFRDFAEGNPEFNTIIDLDEARIPKLYVSPQGITMDHPASKVVFTAQDSPVSAGSITAYDLQVFTTDPTLNPVWINESTVSPSSPNAVHFHLAMQGANGTVYTEKFLDKYEYSEVKFLDAENASIMVFQLFPPASLTINYKNEFFLKTIIYLNSTTENTSVELGNKIVSVSTVQPPFLSKACGVKIYES